MSLDARERLIVALDLPSVAAAEAMTKQLGESRDGELLRAGARRDIDMRSHRLLEAVASDDGHAYGEGEDEGTFHRERDWELSRCHRARRRTIADVTMRWGSGR